MAAIAFDAGAVEARLVLDRSDFTRGIAAAKSEADAAFKGGIPVSFDISQASVTRAMTAARKMFGASRISMPVAFDVSQASVARALTAARGLFGASRIGMPVAFSVSQASVTRALVTARALFAASPITVPVEFTVSQASVMRAVSTARALFAANPVTIPVTFNPAPAAAAAAALRGVTAGTGAAAGAGRGLYGVWGLLAGRAPLFGGVNGALRNMLPAALLAVGGWHLLVDGVAEFLAVVIPATIAVGAFSAAAEPALDQIYIQLTGINTVVQATGRSIAPLSGAFSKVADAVQPKVYQLFGDALTIMNDRTGMFMKLATGTGTVLDQLGARITAAVTSGTGFSKFMANAIPDVAKIGDVIGNLGGILGNFIAVVPGYAEDLLSLAEGFTGLLETVTRVGEPVLRVGLALHGLLLYGGLAVTGVLLLRGPLTSLAVWASGAALGILRLGESMLMTALQGDLLGAAMLLINATGGPVVWITAAVVALGAFVIWMARSKDATQSWLGQLQATISAAPSIAAGITDVGTAQAQVSVKLAQAQKTLAGTTEYGITGQTRFGTAMTGTTAAYQQALRTVDELKAGQAALGGQAAQSAVRLGDLGKAYGGTSAALGLLNAAGITQAQWQDKSGAAWSQIRLQVASTALAYDTMGQKGGLLGDDMDVLNIEASDQFTAMQKLNSAWDQFITFSSGAENSFVSLAEANHALDSGLASSTTSITGKFSTLTGNLLPLKTNLNGVTQSSLQLQQQFQQSYTDSSTLIDSLATAFPAGGKNFTHAVKDIVGQLLPFAKGSHAATDQIALLADRAGYTGPRKLSGMIAWIGKSNISMAGLKRITDKATVSLTNIGKEAANLNNSLAASLNTTVSQTALAVSGSTAAEQLYVTSLLNTGSASASTQADRKALITDLLTVGYTAKTAGTWIDAQTQALGKSGDRILSTGQERQKLIRDYEKQGATAYQAHAYVDGLTKAQLNQSTGALTQAQVRQNLIKDYEKMGETAQQAAIYVDGLRTAQLREARKYASDITVTGHGTWSVAAASSAGSNPYLTGGAGPHIPAKAAAGWRVPGYGGGDRWPALLEGGETVVPKHLTPAVAPLMKAHGVPGFSAGGVAGAYLGSVPGLTGWTKAEWAKSVYAIQASTAAATSAQLASAIATAAAGPGGGAPAANAALARSLFPAWGSGPEWSAWNSVAMAECVPLRTRILTRRGWLTHDEVRVGDETIGYDPERKVSTWTRIERVVRYDAQETVRFGNKYWSAECTPGHRWLMERMFRDFNAGGAESVVGEALTELRDRKRLNRVVLARTADLSGTLPVTVNEAALLGWIAGDGTVSEDSEYWRPRKAPSPDWPLGVSEDAPFGRCRDGRPKKSAGGRPLAEGLKRKTGSVHIVITQSKPEHFAAIEAACQDAPRVGRRVHQPANARWRANHQWQLGADYSRDLLARAGHPKRDAVRQVLAMSPEQRAAWLEAMICGEGSRTPGKTILYQDDGPVADAIELAIYLSGKRPSRTKDSRGEGKSWAIRSTEPTIGGPDRNSFTESTGCQDVWCVTTGLGSWTAEQDGQVFLTGNSGWNQYARNPSSGAYGIPQALPASKMGAAANPPESNPAAQIRWMASYIRSVYGDPISAWAHEASQHWYGKGGHVGSDGTVAPYRSYDSGGGLPPGLTMALNATGRTETVVPAGGVDDITSGLDYVAGLLESVLSVLSAAPAKTGAALGHALSGAARSSVNSSLY